MLLLIYKLIFQDKKTCMDRLEFRFMDLDMRHEHAGNAQVMRCLVAWINISSNAG